MMESVIMAHEPILPRTNDSLADLHCEIASSLEHRLRELAGSLSVVFGDGATRSAFAALLISDHWQPEQRSKLLAELEQKGLSDFLDDELGSGAVDTIEITSICRQAAEYGNQGCVPRERPDVQPSLNDRERRVRDLIGNVACFRRGADALIGAEYSYIWDAFDARKAIDGFGGKASLKGMRVIATVPMAAIRTAVSEGDLQPDQAGFVEPDVALTWLSKRREFCPSRWRNLADDQWPFDPMRGHEDDAEMVLVPQDSDGKPFVPDHVVRPARGGGLSITVGRKGSETQLSDFFDALRKLSELAESDVARWRRRNGVGNWGIVRARGAWVAVSKSEIARQLDALSARALSE